MPPAISAVGSCLRPARPVRKEHREVILELKVGPVVSIADDQLRIVDGKVEASPDRMLHSLSCTQLKRRVAALGSSAFLTRRALASRFQANTASWEFCCSTQFFSNCSTYVHLLFC